MQDTETRQDSDETVFEVDNLSFGSSMQGGTFVDFYLIGGRLPYIAFRVNI